MRLPLAVTCIAVALAAPSRAMQLAPGPINAGSSAIGGRVADAKTGEPLPGVIVTLYEARTARSAEVTTDAEGVYEFTGIADGEFNLVASSDTHGRSCYGASDRMGMRCQSVDLVRDQRRSRVDFNLFRAATIRGRVIDHEDRPVAGARVASGVMQSPLHNSTLTNRNGEFQLTNLPVGPNQLLVVPPPIPGSSRLTDFTYPAQGDVLELLPGALIDGIVIVLPRVIRGSITVNVASAELASGGVTIMVASAAPRMSRRLEPTTDGISTIEDLSEGRYFVYARARHAEGSLAAFETVEVTEGSYDVSLTLRATGRITGRIVSDRGGLPPIDSVRVEASWTHDGVVVEPLARDEAETGPDGYFRIDHMFGTRTIRLVGLPPEWRVQSVRRGRDDVTTGVDVPAGTDVDVTIVVAQR